MRAHLPFSHDASGRLCVSLERGYPARAVNLRRVKAVLKKHFKVTWGDKIEAPFCDEYYWDFTWEGEAFTLHWDLMTGLDLTALHPSGEDRLRQIVAYFETNPPPFLWRWK